MHSGFWSDLDDIRECSVEHGDITNPDELGFDFLVDEEKFLGISPMDFLHGNCDIFARYLHDTYGYRMEAIYFRDELIHAYCVLYQSDTEIYIDIRGMTTNEKEFWSEFEYDPEDFWFAGDYWITDEIPEASAASDWKQAAAHFDDKYRYWS